ncbi:MAG TPA: methyltransferase domain-containing protein [Planctomycetota bacterium]|nr:methyltransferase domain-containing protein [Planctomycetota bacterium]
MLADCPVCRSTERTPVCEYNRFILLEAGATADMARYDYALCHECGLVYATRRPTGDAYRELLANFNESLGRNGTSSIALNPYPLTDEDRRDIEHRVSAGVFVSEETNLGKRDWLPALEDDKIAQAPHVELIASLLPVKGMRVLEVRSRTGAIMDSLRRWFGASVQTMAIFESQQEIIRKAYGIPSDSLIDFEEFSIPYEGKFDLIVSNHMFTHSLKPDAYFAELQSKLVPGGFIYLYNEPDDLIPFPRRKSLFGTMNPFHVQAFNGSVLARGLRRYGFEPMHLTHVNDSLVCAARMDARAAYKPMRAAEREARLTHYRLWRDCSILALPKSARGRFKAEWSMVESRAVEAGVAERDLLGRIVLVKAKKVKASD